MVSAGCVGNSSDIATGSFRKPVDFDFLFDGFEMIGAQHGGNLFGVAVEADAAFGTGHKL
jgi:hypothetical protein